MEMQTVAWDSDKQTYMMDGDWSLLSNITTTQADLQNSSLLESL